jgi:C4-dicarboxylate-specific signal transduction histidine kinase
MARARDRMVGHALLVARLILAAVGLLLEPLTVHADTRPRVLILSSTDSTNMADKLLTRGFVQTLNRNVVHAAEIFTEYLDGARFSGTDIEQTFSRYLATKYAATKFDLVVVLGPLALDFAAKRMPPFDHDVPILFGPISRERVSRVRLDGRMTGIIGDFDAERTVELILRLQPDTRHLLVVAGAGPFDRQWVPRTQRSIAQYAGRFEVEYIIGLSLKDTADRLRSVPPHTAILLLSYFADPEGNKYQPLAVAGYLAPIAAAPVFTFYQTFLGSGVVGGYVERFDASGENLARMGEQILAGGPMPALQDSSERAFMVDARALARWNMSTTNLPPDTIVQYATPSLWQAYRSEVLATLTIFAVQSATIALLLWQAAKRKKAELLLRDSEYRIALAASAEELGFWQVQDSTGAMWASIHCYDMFGIAPRISATVDDFVQAVVPGNRDLLRRCMSNADASLPVEAEVAVAICEGQFRWITVRASPLHVGHARMQISGIFVDITEKRLAELESARQLQEFAHLSRVSTIGELSGAIAHELRQPLASILWNAQAASQILKTDRPDLDELAEVVEDIVSEDQRANVVIDRILSLIKSSPRAVARVDLHELLRTTLDILHSQLLIHHVAVSLGRPTASTIVIGDAVQLQQIFLNLIINGIDAMDNCAVDGRQLAIAIDRTPNGDVVTTVADTGNGIAADVEETMFEPFVTTKSRGLGLGLALCMSIVRSHRGSLKILNNPDRGATAVLVLPSAGSEHSDG